ncbi:MAG: hypothetical protein JXQ66_03145 [Campylobacterales bacterium]|nr:hypothetical protein [Campylobacterales bacterium]
MNIVIFGTGIAGRAIYRKFKDIHRVINFIDNNSLLDGTKYAEVDVISVEKVITKEFDKIAISGAWIDEMKKQLLELGISKDKIWIVEDDSLDFSTNNRVDDTDTIIKEFAKLMRENGISYCIEGSSLLSLLRGQNLSDVPDVDVLVKSQNDLEKIWKLLNENLFLNQNQLIKVLYKKDRPLTKKDTIDKIIIKSNSNPSITEPTVVDINLAVDIGDFYIMDYEADYYLYFNKEFVDGENYFKYKDMELLVPYQAEKYVELLYGKNWRVPAKKWSYLDYGNLLTEAKLIEMMDKK